jgi:16S rRNA (cytidine1402-2'-O)-methyltransferase
MTGVLYIVSTPIGNLEDITMRALRILEEVDLIAAEDTRHTQKLLNKYNIKTHKTSYHEHNRFDKAKILIRHLQEGMDIALVTDAGTPCISDPGWELVDMALSRGIQVSPVPGASAVLCAVTMAGMDTSTFSFYGFMPAKNREKNKLIDDLKKEDKIAILYESPHKLIKTLNYLYENLGDRDIALVKEITKMHEKVMRITLKEAVELYRAEPKGEFVLVLGPQKEEEKKKATIEEIKDNIKSLMDSGISKKEAIKKTARDFNINKREVYNIVMKK